MPTIAELQASVNKAQDALSSFDGRNTQRLLQQLIAAKARLNSAKATATLNDPTTRTPAAVWEAKMVLRQPSLAELRSKYDSLGDSRADKARGAQLQAEIKRRMASGEKDETGVAEWHAAQQTPEWKAAVDAYNTGQPVADMFVPLLNKINVYHRIGEAAPGKMQYGTGAASLKQWGIDAQPGGFDKVMKIAAAGALLFAGGTALGLIGGTEATAASVVGSAAPVAAPTTTGAFTAAQLSGSVMSSAYVAPAIASAPTFATVSGIVDTAPVFESAIPQAVIEATPGLSPFVSVVPSAIPGAAPLVIESASPAFATVADIIQRAPLRPPVSSPALPEKVIDTALAVGTSVGTTALVGTLAPKKPQAPLPAAPSHNGLNVPAILAALAAVGGIVFLT